jgi:hypothetical protein
MVIENFANAILHKEELIAPAKEGVNSLALGNAIMMSSFLGRPIDLPMNGEAYAKKLEDLVKDSRFEKDIHEHDMEDFENSF